MPYGLTNEQLAAIKTIIASYPEIQKAVLFGSYATASYQATADINLAISGDKLPTDLSAKLKAQLKQETNTAVDVIDYEQITSKKLLQHIDDCGVVVCQQGNSDWVECKLGEITKKIGDGLHGTPKYSKNGSYFFINGNNLQSGKIVFKKETKKVDSIEFIKYKKDIDKNTILLSINGTIGNLAFYNNEPCILGKSAAYLNINKNISRIFIYYLMLDNTFQNHISLNANGTTIKNVSLAQLRNYTLHLPPLPEQQAIAEVLSSLDDKIDLLHRQNKTLEDMAQTLFRQWFIEEAQDDWDEVKLGDYIVPKKGKNLTKAQAVKGEFPVVAGGLEPSCYHNKANTNKPVITISASGANAGFIRFYHTKVWSSDSSFIDNSVTDKIFFIYIFLKDKQNILFDKQTGSAQAHIYPKDIMDLTCYKFPDNLMKKFNRFAGVLFNKIGSNQTQIQTLENLRDTLLPKLISGEVRVSYSRDIT